MKNRIKDYIGPEKHDGFPNGDDFQLPQGFDVDGQSGDGARRVDVHVHFVNADSLPPEVIGALVKSLGGDVDEKIKRSMEFGAACVRAREIADDRGLKIDVDFTEDEIFSAIRKQMTKDVQEKLAELVEANEDRGDFIKAAHEYLGERITIAVNDAVEIHKSRSAKSSS